MLIQAKTIKTDIGIPQSMFEVPKDYKITDMQQTLSQFNQSQKKKMPIK